MYSQRVVFIIGAGASYEFNMPTGATFKTNIANALNKEEVRIKFQIDGSRGDTPTWYDAADELVKVMEQFDSIDEALHWFSPHAGCTFGKANDCKRDITS
jgi:NAD-dependent SIR2 family protein deacetylase